MGIAWKKVETVDRLVAALLAAHPGIKLDYANMARYFGQEATYDSIQSHFRSYHKAAAKMIAENPQSSTPTPARRGTVGTPRTPRVGRGGGITKPKSSTRKLSNALKAALAKEANAAKSAKAQGIVDLDDGGVEVLDQENGATAAQGFFEVKQEITGEGHANQENPVEPTEEWLHDIYHEVQGQQSRYRSATITGDTSYFVEDDYA